MDTRATPILAALAGTLIAGTMLSPGETATNGTDSRVTALTVGGTQDVGTFNGVHYMRTYGTVSGVVDPNEKIVGLASLPKNAQGEYEYTSEFEIVAPAAGEPQNDVIFVDAENRGSAVMLNLINQAGVRGTPMKARYPEGIGNGFLQRHATSYARVQWQTGIAKGVPETAQGVGLVVMRDFARMLAGYTAHVAAGRYSPGTYHKLILGGKSQSAWYVNDFIAEGFNVEPITGDGIFQGALSVDGIGIWMRLDNLAAVHHLSLAPYIGPDEPPLKYTQLLTRPHSDPIFIDTVAYTDFYRLRASLTDVAATTPKYRRYDIPGPHAAIKPPARAAMFKACNDGHPVPLNPISMSPYIRAQVVGLEKAIGVKGTQSAHDLPPSVVFKLGPPPKSMANFNPLKGHALKVPLTDANAMPVGGVRFPDVVVPLGKPIPVSLSPVTTQSIDGTCGNRGGFQPFSSAELRAKYGSKDNYLDLYDAQLKKMIAQGFVLAEDEKPMLDYAGYLWDHADGYVAKGVGDQQAAE
jgi:Alpha/beta hydrolase domain